MYVLVWITWMCFWNTRRPCTILKLSSSCFLFYAKQMTILYILLPQIIIKKRKSLLAFFTFVSLISFPYLSMATNTPTESSKWNNFFPFHYILQVTHSTLQVHALDCLSSFTGILEREKTKNMNIFLINSSGLCWTIPSWRSWNQIQKHSLLFFSQSHLKI